MKTILTTFVTCLILQTAAQAALAQDVQNKVDAKLKTIQSWAADPAIVSDANGLKVAFLNKTSG